jgi:hypothetical protein
MFAPLELIQTEVFTEVPQALRKTSTNAERIAAGRGMPKAGCFLEGPSFDRAGNLYFIDQGQTDLNCPTGRVYCLTTCLARMDSSQPCGGRAVSRGHARQCSMAAAVHAVRRSVPHGCIPAALGRARPRRHRARRDRRACGRASGNGRSLNFQSARRAALSRTVVPRRDDDQYRLRRARPQEALHHRLIDRHHSDGARAGRRPRALLAYVAISVRLKRE